MYTKTVILNLITVIKSKADADDNAPFIGFKDMVIEYANDKIYKNIEVFFIVYSSYSGVSKNTIYELKKGILGWYLDDLNIDFKISDIGNSKDLTKIFDKLIDPSKKAYNKVLVTYAHGSGFSMFGNTINKNDAAKNEKKLFLKSEYEYFQTSENIALNFFKNKNNNFQITKCPIINLNNDVPRFFNKIFSKEDTLSVLTIDELSLAISKTNFKKFDAILLANCSMQTIDTFFALKTCTNYIIASETLFSWQGFDYSLFNKLFNKIDDKFLKSFTYFSFLKLNDYNKKFETENLYSKNDMLLSIIKCENANSFFDNFNLLIIALQTLEIDDKFINHISNGENLNGGSLRDLENILIQISNKFQFLKDIVDNCVSQLKGTIIYIEEGENFISKKEKPLIGMSINVPIDIYSMGYFQIFSAPFLAEEDTDGNLIYDKNKKNTYQSSFSKNSKWGELLFKVLKEANLIKVKN